MQDIIIDEEFVSLLPALDNQTYASLEENIISNGCRDSLVLWDGYLIDGHNRYKICTEHNISFTTIEKEFASREDVLIWIITNQISRRNLNPRQLSHYRGLHYRADKKIQGTRDRTAPEFINDHNDHLSETTAKRLGRQYKVAQITIRRDAKASEATDAIGSVSPEAKRMILSEEVKIDKKTLEALASATKDEIAEIASKIEDGTFEKKKPESDAAPKPDTPVDSLLIGMQPLDKAIIKVTSNFTAGLQEIRKKADRTKLQKALRAYINTLEELYSTI